MDYWVQRFFTAKRIIFVQKKAMVFKEELVHGILNKRIKRFLAEVTLDNGEIVLAHCTNSGSMKSCLETGAEVFLSPVNDPKRRTQYTWEMIKINGNWVGINTANPNKLAFKAVSTGKIPGLDKFTFIKREVKFEDSRFDLYAENECEKCFIEVKNVTFKEGKYALFPDAVTERGQKHLRTLIEVRRKGIRAVMFFIVQRIDVEVFSPSFQIDSVYAKVLVEAYKEGVEIFVWMVEVTPKQIQFIKSLPLELLQAK